MVNAVVTIDLRQQIDTALSNGKELFDEATTLFKDNRLKRCAALDILAYEEFNKAKKMAGFYARKKAFRHSDLEHLTDGHSHIQKVLIHAVSFGNMLKRDSIQMFNDKSNFALQIGLPFPVLPREFAVVMHNDTMRYFAKLHDLRKALMYSGSDNDRFDIETLRAICGYLYYEVVIPYYETRFNLYLVDNGIMWQRGLTATQLDAVRENPDKIALSVIHLLCQTPTFIEHYRLTRNVLDSLTTGDASAAI